MADFGMRIDVKTDGPYLVSGAVPLVRVRIVRNEENEAVDWEQTGTFPAQDVYALCRCGASNNKPFCDGTHARAGFEGTETARREPYKEGARQFDGGDVVLHDNQSFCIGAEFCDRLGSVWALARTTPESSGVADPAEAAALTKKAHEIATDQACKCPSGRLVMHHVADGADGAESAEGADLIIEPDFPEPSVALIEDPAYNASAAIWVRGGIPIFGADEQPYEIRNRVTLCRCGASFNKPFCNGAHYQAGFNDALEKE